MWRDVIVVCRHADLMESYDFMVALLGPDWAEKMKNEERRTKSLPKLREPKKPGLGRT